MDNFIKDIKQFFFEQRYGVILEKLKQRDDYDDLVEKGLQAQHDLIDGDPEIKRKYTVYNDLWARIEGRQQFQTYLQGIQDAHMFKQILG